MKTWLHMFAAVLLITGFSPESWSVENPGIRNPAGYGTIPQSSFRSGLVNTPNPIDPTGNLLMTGNVRRGMHFRGSVPYGSTTSFNAPLGSSALNSFLRDTAGAEDFEDRSNKYRVQPFYSPTQTVTTMVPGRSEVFSPMGMRIDDRVRQGTPFVGDGLLGLDSSPRGQTSPDQDISTGDSDFRELQRRYHLLAEPPSTSEDTLSSGISLSSQQIERLVPGQLGIRQERDISADQSGQRIRDASSRMQDTVADSDRESESGFIDLQRRQNLPARDDLTQYPGEQLDLKNLKTKIERLEPEDSAHAGDSVQAPLGFDAPDRIAPATTSTPDEDARAKDQDLDPVSKERRELLEQIRRQLDALTKSVEAGLQEEAGSIPNTRSRDSMLDERDFRIKTPELLDSQLGSATISQTQTPLESRKTVNEVGFLSIGDAGVPPSKRALVTRHNSTVENYEDLESFSQSRFNQHIQAAEDYLKSGQYYRAVDSFTLASIYQPNNPVVLAGKGHALFAAGEYMSSALFLARAIAVRPDYTQAKVDLAAMLGGADKLAERIDDVEQWLDRSGSVQLQFLLSYVYFHTGRLSQAKQVITAAYEKMPQSPAVEALRTAINQVAR